MFGIKKVIREYKELKYLAYHDSLTGLLNRNWLYKNIDNIFFKYVYFLDINNLHKINEKGHTFGDNYIKEAVKSLILLKDDILIRYAGDEFILFSNRSNVVETSYYFAVGFVEIYSKDLTISINMADNNMLKAKRLYKLTNKTK